MNQNTALGIAEIHLRSVIQSLTGSRPDCQKWATGYVVCEIPRFAIGETGYDIRRFFDSVRYALDGYVEIDETYPPIGSVDYSKWAFRIRWAPAILGSPYSR